MGSSHIVRFGEQLEMVSKCSIAFGLCQTTLLLCITIANCVDAFTLTSPQNARTTCNSFTVSSLSHLRYSKDSTQDDIDWRAFRAQLVHSESNDSSTTNMDKIEHWAYDSGDFVEPGSVVISIPSSDETANDMDALNNQCYRKCILLVLDIKTNFIQGASY